MPVEEWEVAQKMELWALFLHPKLGCVDKAVRLGCLSAVEG